MIFDIYKLFILSLELIWLFLPSCFANITPVILKKVNLLNYPIDFNLKIKGEPVFGSNKTIKGVIGGILMAILIVLIQNYFCGYFIPISLIFYWKYNPLTLGICLGCGTMFGDLFKSFIKRRLKIPPGRVWFPFDQLDWIVGSYLFISPFITFSITQVLVGLILFSIIHIIFNYFAYLFGIQNNKF